jgi:hypothetical protein
MFVANRTLVPYVNESIKFGGTGTIRAAVGGALELTVVALDAGSEITAENLTVFEGLTLTGGAVLKPQADTLIVLKENVFFELAEFEGALPTVVLGEIGENFTVVPSVVAVAIKAADYSAEELNRLDAVLVEGRTLGNCEDWSERVDLGTESGQFETYCKSWEQEGRKLQSANERVSLNLKHKKQDSHDRSTSASLAWIAAPVVVVAVAVAAAFKTPSLSLAIVNLKRANE